MPGEAQTEVEFLPFPQVVRRAALAALGGAKPLDRGALALEAIGPACQDLPDDSPLIPSAVHRGTQREIQATLERLHEYGIDPERLRSAAVGASPRLARLLLSLAQIDESIERTLEGLGRSRLTQLVDQCSASSPSTAPLPHWLHVAGSELPPRDAALLSWAAESGVRVGVVLDRGVGDAPLFAQAERAAKRLEGAQRDSPNPDTPLLDALFTDRTATPHTGPEVEIATAGDSLSECEWALRGCLREMERGVPAARLAIYARDPEGLAPLLEASATRLGVPIRLARRAPLLSNGYARLSLDALRAAVSDDLRYVEPLALSSYGERGARVKLEGVISTCRSSASPWSAVATACSDQPELAWLGKLARWTLEARREAHSLGEWCGQLRTLVGCLPIDPWAPNPTQERDARAAQAMQDPILQRASVERLGASSQRTIEAFVRFCHAAWADADVSLPEASAGVRVTHRADGLPDLESLFVLGCLEGRFPRRRRENPILSDRDLEELSRLAEVEPLPNSRDAARAERDEFYRLCAAPSKRICLSYPVTDEDRDNVPAFYLAEIERAAVGVRRVSHPRTELTPAREACLAGRDRDLADALALPPGPETPANLSTEAGRKLLTDRIAGGLSPADFRDASQCPFRYFAGRVLGVGSRDASTLWRALYRLPRDARLPAQPDPEAARQALRDALSELIGRLKAEAEPWELAAIQARGGRLIEEWVDREFAARRHWPRTPGSVRAEAKFGENPLGDKTPTNLPLVGTVPATADIGPYPALQVFEAGPLQLGQKPDEADQLYIGLHLLARYSNGRAVAVEVDSPGGRVLYVMPRARGDGLSGKGEELRVCNLADLTNAQDELTQRRDFYGAVAKLGREAAGRLQAGDIQPRPGDYCETCAYGELCRMSRDFGEGGAG